MKNKITTIILFLIMMILIVGIVVIGYVIYVDIFENNSDSQVAFKPDNIITEKTNDDKEKNVEEENQIKESLLNILENSTSENKMEGQVTYQESTINQYFYDQLNNTQKIIYDALKQNKQNLMQGNFIIDFGDQFSDMLSEETGSDELCNDYQTAVETFMHDNPDMFYIDVNKMYINIKTTVKLFNTKNEVYISAADNATYLSEDFNNRSQIEMAMRAIEKVKNNILRNLKGTDYQKILYIHDYLIDNIEYDSTYNAIGTYSIYGALIGKKCVCEGYAKAFKYLLNEAGIECEIMQGTGINSTGNSESHAWNCVNLNNTWYATDVTWDDPIVMGVNGEVNRGGTPKNMKYRYFLKSYNTISKDHILEYQFSDNGKIYTYPKLSSTDY